MPSHTLRKSEKLEALEAMTKAKFLNEHKALMNRRRDLLERIYDDTFGKIGNRLAETAGSKFSYWLDTTNYLGCHGLDVPHLLVPEKPGSEKLTDFFTGKSEHRIRPSDFGQQITRQVVKPDRDYSFSLDLGDCKKTTIRVAETLNKNCDDFNNRVSGFYWQAYDVLMKIRTTKQVDERIPELWKFLPDGLRERLKQGLIVLSQAEVDLVRSQIADIK